jgi:hypothetical protein
MIMSGLVNKARGLLEKHHFLKIAMEKGILGIKLSNGP